MKVVPLAIYRRGTLKRRIFFHSGAFFFSLLPFLGCSAIPRTEGTAADAEYRAAGVLSSQGAFDSSLVLYRHAAMQFQKEQRQRSYLESLNAIADILIRQSRFAEAEGLLDSITRQPSELAREDSVVFPETFYLLAYVANYSNRYDDALAYLDRSLMLQQRYCSPSGRFNAQNEYLRGVIFLRKGEYESARVALSRAYNIQTTGSQIPPVDRAVTTYTLGVVDDASGRYSSAMGRYAEALQLLTSNQKGESQFAATAYHCMSVSSRSLGEFEAAAAYEHKSLALLEGLYGHQHLAVSSALAQLGDIYTWQGDYVPAREHYQEALAIMRRLLEPGHSSIAEIERKLARLALETNQLDSARALITRAASSKSKILRDHPAMGDMYEDMGDIARAGKESANALDYYRRAITIKRTIGAPPPYLDLATLYQKIGEVHLSEGKLDEASVTLRTAGSLQDSSLSHNPFLASAILRSLGDIQRKQGLIDEALKSYARALEELSADAQNGLASKQAIGLFASRGELLKERSRMPGAGVSDLKAAVACLDSAAALLVQLRKGYQASESKITLQEELSPVLDAGLSLCAEIYRRTGEREFVSAAFHFAELSKASVLLETMQDAKEKILAGVPDSLLEHERRLSEIISVSESHLVRCSHTEDSIALAALRHRVFAARRERDQLQENLMAAFPAYRNLQMQDNSASLERVRGSLPPKTALLSYAIGGDSLYLFTLSPLGSELYCLGPFQRIDESARLLRTAIKTVDPPGYLQHAHLLYRKLIEPAKRDLVGSTRLVVVPDGILNSIPFGALLSEDLPQKTTPAKADFTKLPYLITSFEVIHALSGTLYQETITAPSRPAPPEQTFAGYAPVFLDSSEPLALAQSLRGNERSVTLDGKTYAQLKYSEEEVRAIASAFDDAGIPVAGYFYQDATKERFLATAAKYSIVHIATHGVIDEQSPALSGILFSPAREGPATEEDILYAGETYNLRLRANLLVLGVCESGLGKYVRGEGVMALTRGFTCAGARNIAYALWKVYDRHASTLMRRFYAHVLKGEQYSSALRDAKLEMIADRSTAFPLAWAGFVLAGE
jgi:CHAT domain-containing protein/predicted negative regulator of RcsB-dependent stress response